MDKFNLNPILININKLKPYKFINDNTLQLVFAKPTDLTIEIPIQNEIPKPWHVENDIFEPIVFELVANDSIDGPITTNNVPICNHHSNAPIHNY